MTDPWRSIDAYLAAKGVRFGPPTIGQTTGGTHAKSSLHYVGRARDYGRSNSDLARILVELKPFAAGPAHLIQELYGVATYWKSGRPIVPSRSLRASHQDHVHVGLRADALLPDERPPPPLEVPPRMNVTISGVVVDVLKAPGGGVWMLTDVGAIYAWECEDKGAPNRHPEYWAGRRAARLEPLGDGYSVVASDGARYDYP